MHVTSATKGVFVVDSRFVKPEILRWIVVTARLIAAVAFFVKG